MTGPRALGEGGRGLNPEKSPAWTWLMGIDGRTKPQDSTEPGR